MTPPSFSAKKVKCGPDTHLCHSASAFLILVILGLWDYSGGDFSTAILPKKTKQSTTKEKTKLLLLPDVKMRQAIGRHGGKLRCIVGDVVYGHCPRCSTMTLFQGNFKTLFKLLHNLCVGEQWRPKLSDKNVPDDLFPSF